MTGPITKTFYRVNKAFLVLSNLLVGLTFDPNRDIVLITGGSGGLGKELALLFKSKGAVVVVFDLLVPESSGDQFVEGVKYIHCDVSNKDSVKNSAQEVFETIGIVTILINNAGITTGETVLQLSYTQIETTMAVNLMSSFYTIKTFLPKMLKIKRGYIITVASTLGYMSPARLSAYGASKSGLIALHESLTYELGSPAFNTTGVKTLLICPGQLKTSLFEGVKTPHTLLAPELEPKYVAKEIVKAVQLGKRGEIRMPFYGNFLPLFRSAPWPIVQAARYISGIDRSMVGFVTKIHNAGESSANLLIHTANKMSSVISFINSSEDN